jgi:hypothetical protein
MLVCHCDGRLNIHLYTKAGEMPRDETTKKGDNRLVKAYSLEPGGGSEARRHKLYRGPSGHNHGKVFPRIFQDD